MLHCDAPKADVKADVLRAFASLNRCPHCGDLMIAPVASEFVDGDEIRHHWECDACGRPSSSTIPLDCEDEA